MSIRKFAAVTLSIALAAGAARAEQPDTTVPNLAAQCAAKNGLFDPNSLECAEPTEGSAAGDLLVGPMMRVLGPEVQDLDAAADGQ